MSDETAAIGAFRREIKSATIEAAGSRPVGIENIDIASSDLWTCTGKSTTATPTK